MNTTEYDDVIAILAGNRFEDYRYDLSRYGSGIKCVEEIGGYEGGGETVRRVYEIINPSGELEYYEKTGYYTSEWGTEWDSGFARVYPREVMITIYE
jgi:hypothetical protein